MQSTRQHSTAQHSARVLRAPACPPPPSPQILHRAPPPPPWPPSLEVLQVKLSQYQYLIPPHLREAKPSYFMVGGLVFTACSGERAGGSHYKEEKGALSRRRTLVAPRTLAHHPQARSAGCKM